MLEEQLYFRRMLEDDIPAVAEIEKSVFSRPWSEDSFIQAMRQDTLFVTALEDNMVIGYCGMYCSFGEGEITNVAVIPKEQGRGIGRKMMKYLLESAQEKGVDRVILEVRISNENAIHLYKKLGFCSCGIRRNFYEMPREDGMVMELGL